MSRIEGYLVRSRRFSFFAKASFSQPNMSRTRESHDRRRQTDTTGTTMDKNPVSEGPAIILVEPQLGENIGMVARAMANFGLGRTAAGQSARRLAEREGAGRGQQAPTTSSTAAAVFDDLAAAIADLEFRLRHDGARARRLQAGARAGRGGADAAGAGSSGAAHRHPVRARAVRPVQRGGRRWPTRSSPFRSIRPSPRSTSRRPCC